MSGRLQAGTPCPRTGSHLRPQAPQLSTVLTGVSQPSSGAGAAGREQLPLPKLHVEVHSPVEQAAVATPVREQARPQAPQWAMSLPTSTQVEPQQLVAAPAVQGLLQMPQFIGSLE